MKAFLVAVVLGTIAVAAVSAADPECEYRQAHNWPKHWANPTDCGRFFRCNNRNVKREIICDPDKEYNTRTGRCVKRGRGACNLRLDSPVPAAVSNICEDAVDGYYYGDAEFCRDFYICYAQSAYAESCDPGSRFDLTSAVCVPDNDNVCWQNFCIGKANGLTLGSAVSCRTYYTCDDDKATKSTCESGSYFDAETESCEDDTDSTHCWENYCLSKESGDYLPDPEDCYKFYICYNGNAVAQECPTDSYFDLEDLNCQPGECPIDISTTDANTDETTEETTVETTDDTTEPNTDDTTDSTTDVNTESTDFTTDDNTESTDSTTDNNTETTESTTDDNTESTDSTTDDNTESTESTTDNNTESTDSTTDDNTESTDSTTDNNTDTTESTTDGNAESTDSTTDDNTESTESTTDDNTESTESTTDDNTESTDSTTDVNTESTEPITETTESTTDYTTEPTTPDTTETTSSDSTTECTGETTEVSTEEITVPCTGETTEVSTQETTVACTGETTEISTQETTVACTGETTEEATEETTVSCTGETTEATPEETTVPCTGETTEISTEITTQEITEETTAACTGETTEPTTLCTEESTEATTPCTAEVTAFIRPNVHSRSRRSVKEYSENMNPEMEAQLNIATENSDTFAIHGEPISNILKTEYNDNGLLSDTNVKNNRKNKDVKPKNCLGVYFIGQIIVYPEDCSKFLVCTKEGLNIESCPVGEFFDKFLGRCRIDLDYVCLDYLKETEENKVHSTSGCLGLYREGQMTTYGKDCRKYQICKSGRLVIRDCGIDKYFDSVNQTCEWDTNTFCAANKATCLNIYREGEIIPHPLDCRKFQFCHKGNLNLQDCGLGNYFDGEENMCKVDTENICPILEEPEIEKEIPALLNTTLTCLNIYREGQIVAHPQDCRKYQICNTGILIQVDCGLGNYFDAVNDMCQLDSEAICETNRPSCMDLYMEGEKISHPLECRQFHICHEGNLNLQDCGIGKYFDNEEKACKIDTDNICPIFNATETESHIKIDSEEPMSCLGIYRDGEMVAHPEDCRKYQICNTGILVQVDCGLGNYFDAVNDMCQLDSEAICETNRPSCMDLYMEGEKISHPLECRQFHICHEGNLNLQDCGIGKYFDNEEKACKIDTDNICPIFNATETESHIKIDSEEPMSCLGIYRDGEMVAHPEDCRKYQICNAGHLISLDCGLGNYFNSINASCQQDILRVCAANKPSCLNLYYEGQKVDHPFDCRKFQICYDAKLRIQDCGVGKYFDNISQACQIDADNICNSSDAENEAFHVPKYLEEPACLGLYYEGDLVPHPEDCRRFQVCTRNKLIIQDCGLGKYFDSVNGHCQLDTEMMCASNKPSCMGLYFEGQMLAHPIECRKFQLCYEGQLLTQDCGVGKYYNNANANCQLDTENLCASQQEVRFVEDQQLAMPSCLGIYYEGEYVAHPSDCRKYQLCYNHRLVERDCGQGNYFDAGNNICQLDVERVCASNKPTCMGLYYEGQKLAHPQNCRKFQVCYGGKLNTQDCGMGKYFNITGNNCELDVNQLCVVTDEENDNFLLSQIFDNDLEQNCLGLYSEGEMVPHPTQCRKYQICHGGRLLTRDCGRGNYFDGSSGICQLDKNKLCQVAETNEPQNHWLMMGSIGSNHLKNHTTISFYQHKLKKYSAPRPHRYSYLTCNLTYMEGQLVRHPADCNKYLICLDGALQVQDCGLGNFYNNLTESCEFDLEKKCRPKRIDIKKNYYQQPESTADSTTGCTACPGGAAEGDIVAHADCDKFYICTNGELVEQSCLPCYKFESCTGTCILDTCHTCWPADSTECGNGDPPVDPDVCETRPDGDRVAAPDDCASYYLCYDQVGILEPCSPGEWFNPELAECAPDVDATCTNPCSGTTGIQYLPNPDCSKFYLCQNGLTTVESCPEGEGFDIETGVCQLDAECESTMCVGRPDGTTYPITGDPTKFYYCLDGVAIITNCEEDETYSSDYGICIMGPSSDCDQTVCAQTTGITNAFPTISGTSNAFCYCSDGAAYKGYCDTDYVFNADYGVCLYDGPCDPEFCKDEPDYTVSANKEDTSSFCLCVMHEPVIVTCPNNEIFNPSTLLCQTAPAEDPNCDVMYCLSEPDYTVFPSSTTDAGFCLCKDGAATYTPCPTNELYNTDYGACLPANSYCNVDICAVATGSPFPAFNDPHSFCYCTDESTVVMRTCSNDEVFSPTLLICMTDPCDPYFCADANNDGVFFEATNFPNGFCWCNNGIAELMTCNANQVFDPSYGVCVTQSRRKLPRFLEL